MTLESLSLLNQRKVRRLKLRTTIDPNTNCWLYDGYLNHHGYGECSFNNKTVKIHRLSAHLFLKLDLNDKSNQALHKKECPNRNCWNPEHLYIGTQANNMTDWLSIFIPKRI